MHAMKVNKIFFLVFGIILAALILESCAASKDCGCGTDLNRSYKAPKRYH